MVKMSMKSGTNAKMRPKALLPIETTEINVSSIGRDRCFVMLVKKAYRYAAACHVNLKGAPAELL